MHHDETKKYSSELMTMLIQGAIGLNTVQGIELGFFDWIPINKPITAHELSGQLGYDITKVERWLRFAVTYGYIITSGGGYTLTTKGSLLRRGTPTPGLLGLHHENADRHAAQDGGVGRVDGRGDVGAAVRRLIMVGHSSGTALGHGVLLAVATARRARE